MKKTDGQLSVNECANALSTYKVNIITELH